MIFVVLELMWAGYAVAYDGWFQLQGGTAGFLSYIAPGRDKTEKGFMFQSPCKGTKGTKGTKGKQPSNLPGLPTAPLVG